MFRSATPEKQRRAALVASEIALSRVGLDDDGVKEALAVLTAGHVGDIVLYERITALASRLDNDYFRLREEGADSKNPAALHLFSKARAAYALAFAVAGDAAQLHEAVYEAVSAADDATEIVQAVEAALR